MARASPGIVVLVVLQLACSLTVISLTTGRLAKGGEQCLLSSDRHNAAPCQLAVAAGAVSIATAVVAGCVRCLSCDCCGLGPVANVLLAAFNSAWWLAAAALLTAFAAAADAGRVPGAAYRHALLGAAWAAAASEIAHAVLACVVVGNNACNILLCVPWAPAADEECCAGCEECCCGGSGGCGACCCGGRGRRRAHTHATAEPLLLPGAAVLATAALVKRGWWGERRPAAAWPHAAAAAAPAGAAAGLAAGGSFMPPPPTAGHSYIYGAQQAPLPVGVGVPAAPPEAAHPQAGGSFGGFGPAGGAGFPVASTPVMGGPPAGAAGPTAPPMPGGAAYVPPVVLHQQQQQQGFATAPEVPSISGEDYPKVFKG